jgi:trimeric autotransporter adhesin
MNRFGTGASAWLRAATTVAVLLLLALAGTAAFAQVDVTATSGTPSASYATLKLAFDAINAGTQGGGLAIGISASTSETAPAVLNASGSGSASYTSITISPTGGAARTISGAIVAGSPLIDLNGADNVTIDGLNTGGNSLTISNTTASATTGTSTIRFIGGATANTIRNCSIQGSFSGSVATNGGDIFFSTDANTTNGNDNNTISYCNIGPAGTSLPTKGVYSNGSTTTTAINNSGIVIDNNNIFDCFGAAVTSGAVYIAGGSTDITVSNNRIYQTATRTQTTGAQHSGIWISNSTSGNNFQITGNTIGFASSTQTGTYTFAGVASSSVIPVFLSVGTTTASSVQGNTIAGIAMSGVLSGTSSSSPFRGIYVSSGLAYIGATSAGASGTGNTIGAAGATGSITFTSSSASASDVRAMFNYGSSNWIVMNNNIGGITASNSSTGASNVYGITYNTSSAATTTVQNNTVGGTVANSMQSTSTATGTVVQGLLASTSVSTATGNVIRNLTAAGGTGTGTLPAVAGIVMGSSSVNNTVSQNTIHSLSSTNATTTGHITGIMYQGSTGANLVERNLIHSLSAASASAVINGIYINAGTATYQNNMIRLGIDASGSAITTGCAINGINETAAGTDNMYFNSVFIGGAGVGGSANTFAFQSAITVNVRNYKDNIFWNNRGNGAGTGKHYAIRVGGTAANPAGLASDYNDLLADGTGGIVGLFNAVDQATLAAWRTATGQDAASLAGNPQFIAPNGTASTVDLHIHPTNPTVIEQAGLAIGSVTNDYDGQTRASYTPTDMGADCGNFVASDISPPAIVYTPLGNTCATMARSLTATITDASIVPRNGIGLPVLYWNINAGAYVGATASYVGGNDFSFSFGSGVVAGDVVRYFVVAQDSASTPNVGSQPGGAGGFTANPPVASTPPASPSSYTIQSTLAGGTYAIPGSYATLTAAVAEYNTKCMGGPIVFELAAGYSSAGETFPITIGTNPDASTTNTLTIRPAAGQTPTISGSVLSGALIKLNGADYVIIDGSNSGGTDRSLTLTNSSTTGPCGIWIASLGNGAGATNNTVKNCNINTNSATTATAYAISISGATIGSAGGDNDAVTVQNNAINSANIGVYANGNAAASAGGMDNLTVAGNAFTCTSTLSPVYGVEVLNALNASVSNNSVNLTTSAGTQPVGISLETNVSNSSVVANQITAVVTTSTSGYGGRGITVGTGTTSSNITLANNFVAGVSGSNYSSFGNSSAMGIAIGVAGSSGTLTTTTGGVKLYHNSVNMSGNYSYATACLTAGLYVGSGASTLDIRNNIIVNSMNNTNASGTASKNYAVYSAVANTAYAPISYNDYYVSGTQGVLGFLTTDQTTLSAFNTAFTGSASTPGYNLVAPFVTTTDLHLPAALSTMLESGGASGTGVTVDIDNQARPGPPGSVNGGGTAPDVGADEFDGAPVVNNDMAAAAFVSPTSGGSVTVGVAFDPQASFTNVGLAEQTAVTVRYRIVGPSPSTTEVYNQTASIASIASLATTTVTFASTTLAAAGSYTVYAASELAGDQRPANDQITGSIAAMAPLSGTYLVGTSAFRQASGLDLTFERKVEKVTREVLERAEPAGERGLSADQPTWRTVVREIEIVTWVPMLNGQMFTGRLGVTRAENPGLPADLRSGAYATITAAVADLNGVGVSGPVTFLLTDATYPSETFPITLNVGPSAPTATNTVTISPNTGVASTISGSLSSAALIKLNGIDYVTIDGSNSGGTDRSLTITNSNTTAPCGIWIASLGNGAGATNDTVKNCNINTSSATTTTAYGISVSGSTIGSAGGDNDNVTLQNNAINSSNIGVYANGNAAVSAGGADNLSITGNAFTCTSTMYTIYGVEVLNALNASVSRNTFNLTTSAGTQPVGISIEANVSNSSVTSNQITAVVTTSTGGYGGRGITVGTGTTSSNITVDNNFVAGVNGSNYSSFSNSSAMGIGIGVAGGSSTMTTVTGGVNLYHNSINMSGSYSYTSACLTAGLWVGSGASALDIRNNIIVNSMNNTNASGTASKNYALYSAAANTAYAPISYNDYYVSGTQGVLGYLGSDQTTLSAFNTAFTGSPSTPAYNLVAPFATATDLHLPAAYVTMLESGGTSGTGVTVDIDNQARPGPPGSVNGGGTAPDVGADEFDGTPLNPNDMAATAFVNPTSGGSVSVGVAFDPQASFTNLGTAAQTGVTVRYRIVGPSPSSAEVYNQTASIASIAGYATTTVTFPSATVAAAGTYTIYAASELAGDQAPANDQITGSIAALQPMAGTYLVGSSVFKQASGLDLTFAPKVEKVTREVLEPADPASDRTSAADQLAWKTVVREVEEVTWVPMLHGQNFTGRLGVTREENPGLPSDIRSGAYATITAAVADLNARGVSGPVAFLLTDATYPSETFPITVNVAAAPPTATNTVTIKPNTGVTSAVSGASASGAIFKVFKTNYVTIDGSNAESGTSRDLTLENTSITSPSVIWFGSNGTTPVTNGTIKNCVVRDGANTASAIVLSDGTTAGNPGYFSSMELRNNKIEKAYIGVYANGGTTPPNGFGLIYAQNELNASGANAIAHVGLYMQGVSGGAVTNNDIGGFETAAGENDFGVWLATGTTNVAVSANRIHGIRYTGTSGYGPKGIAVSTGLAAANVAISNNMIFDIAGDGDNYVSYGCTYSPAGIYVYGATQGGVEIADNSIFLYGNTINYDAGAYSVGIALDDGASATVSGNNVVNNLGRLSATGGGAAAIALEIGASQLTAGDYNNLYCNSTGGGANLVGKIGATDYATLAAWRTASGRDANSISADPQYVGVADLHIRVDVASPVNNAGAPIAGITSDYDGDTRSAVPDIGADETYTLTTAVVGNGSVQVAPAQLAFNGGTSVTLTAIPGDECHEFTGWSGDALGNANPLVMVMDSNKSITANFALKTFTLATAVVGGGSLTIAPNLPAYDCGASVQITAHAALGWQFYHWTGGATGVDNPLTVIMSGNTSITAIFVDIAPPSVTLVSPNGGEAWNAGENQPITWTATDNVGVTAIDLAYSTDGGATYPNTIATGLVNTGSYEWAVPNVDTETARVRVTAHDAANHATADDSNADFAIHSSEAGVADVLLGPGEVLGVYPNPAYAGSAHVLYRVPEATTVEVGVYDVTGKLVTRIASGAFAGGVRTAKWDGRDEAGNAVSGGIYLVRLVTGSGVRQTKRLVLFR